MDPIVVSVNGTALSEYIAPLVFALSGAGARFVMSGDEKTLLSFFANIVTGTFAGALIYCFSGQIITNHEYRSGLVGLASFSSADLLPRLQKIFLRRIDKTADEDKKPEDKKPEDKKPNDKESC